MAMQPAIFAYCVFFFSYTYNTAPRDLYVPSNLWKTRVLRIKHESSQLLSPRSVSKANGVITNHDKPSSFFSRVFFYQALFICFLSDKDETPDNALRFGKFIFHFLILLYYLYRMLNALNKKKSFLSWAGNLFFRGCGCIFNI